MSAHSKDDTAVVEWQGPLVVRPNGSTNLERWAFSRRSSIDQALLEHGAILFRGFNLESSTRFQVIAETLCDRLLDYMYRSTPRTAVGDHIYTATEYRPDATIPQHNENAYQRDWPMRLVFGCLQPANDGGRTPLALTANVTRRVDREIRDVFRARNVMYVRNYGEGVDLPWQTTFQTESKGDVEAYCRCGDIAYEWLPDDVLRTSQVCRGLAHHPLTGEELWFNQAHLFHLSALPVAERAALLELFTAREVPRNAYFGDGGAIDEEVLARIRRAYEAELFTFAWQHGDVLLIDNMLVSHGREPFSGNRTVLVAMGDAYSAQDGAVPWPVQVCHR